MKVLICIDGSELSELAFKCGSIKVISLNYLNLTSKTLIQILVSIWNFTIKCICHTVYANTLHREGNEVTCFHCIHPPYFPGK